MTPEQPSREGCFTVPVKGGDDAIPLAAIRFDAVQIFLGDLHHQREKPETGMV
jgi:hypothetical protein